MIGRLTGTLLQKQPPSLLIDVQGVGYEAQAPMSTFYRLPKIGETVVLCTHLQVREDAHTLFAFSSEAERQLFRELIRVSGIGAKMALAVLSGISVEDFASVIELGDRDRLTRVPGIGKKTAERLLVELRDRREQLGDVSGVELRSARAEDEAAEALIALGYSPAESRRLLKAVGDPEASAEELIRAALKKALK